MKKSILNLGKTLNKKEQQTINGGLPIDGNPGGKITCMVNGVCVITATLRCKEILCQLL